MKGLFQLHWLLLLFASTDSAAIQFVDIAAATTKSDDNNNDQKHRQSKYSSCTEPLKCEIFEFFDDRSPSFLSLRGANRHFRDAGNEYLWFRLRFLTANNEQDKDLMRRIGRGDILRFWFLVPHILNHSKEPLDIRLLRHRLREPGCIISFSQIYQKYLQFLMENPGFFDLLKEAGDDLSGFVLPNYLEFEWNAHVQGLILQLSGLQDGHDLLHRLQGRMMTCQKTKILRNRLQGDSFVFSLLPQVFSCLGFKYFAS